MQFEWHPDEPPPVLEEHSKAKLAVLRKYLRAYFDRLNINPSRDEFRITLVDGFAGGGAFRDENAIAPGTPLIMLEESIAAKNRWNQNRAKPLRFDCKYYFVDVETAHTDHLKKVLDERDHKVDNKKIVVLNRKFEDVVDDIINEILLRQPRAGRSIFLLDQTGFSQVESALVARIFQKLPAAEVILTFAADALINHLAMTPQLIKAVAPIGLTETEIKDLLSYKDGEGGRALCQRVLRDRIRRVTGATYDTPFFIRPQKSRRALWFLHLSRHPIARDVMIQCHWDISNTFEHYGPGGFGMLGWEALRSQTVPLFHFTGHEEEQMRKQLLESMPRELFLLASEQPVTIDTVRHLLANKTAARFSDLDQVILKLTQEKEIEILGPDGKPRSRALKQASPTDRIVFPRTLWLPGFSRLDPP